MPLIPLKTDPTRSELRQFAGIWLPLFCFVLAAVAWTSYASLGWAAIAVIAGIAIGGAGWTHPEWFRPLFVGWMFAVYPIGWVVSHVLLAVLYFGIITPIGLVLRLAGRDPLHRRFDPQADTYWQPHEFPPDDTRYYRQY